MLHQAVSGRFLAAGPAIIVPVFAADLEAIKNDLMGPPDAWGARKLRPYDHSNARPDLEIGPFLVEQHERDHVEIFGGTPVGVALAKMHLFQSGRLHYLLNKLKDYVGGPLRVEPPFAQWLRTFATLRFRWIDRSTIFELPEVQQDKVWAHCGAMLSEIEAYQRAERTLLGVPSDRPGVDADALNQVLHQIRGFQEVPHAAPRIVAGDWEDIAWAIEHELSGEAVIEAHAILREQHFLHHCTRAGKDTFERWGRTRILAQDDRNHVLNAGAHVLRLFQLYERTQNAFFDPLQQRAILDLALLAPLDPATWAHEELPLDTVHPGCRFGRLLEVLSEPGLMPQRLTRPFVDELFESLGWPTLSEVAQRAAVQAPYGDAIFDLARAQYGAFGLMGNDLGSLNPLRRQREELQRALTMRFAKPDMFAHFDGPHAVRGPISYFSDRVLFGEGLPVQIARGLHLRMIASLLGAWLLNGDRIHYKVASHAYASLLLESARPEWNGAFDSKDLGHPDEVLRTQFAIDESGFSFPTRAAKRDGDSSLEGRGPRMPHAMTMVRTQRQVSINVYDTYGNLFQGAQIDFLVDATLAGSVHSSDGRASIEVPDDVSVEVRATCGHVTQAFNLQSDETMHDFHMPTVSLGTAAPPEARCADGTTGQPCVDCRVGNITVRICG